MADKVEMTPEELREIKLDLSGWRLSPAYYSDIERFVAYIQRLLAEVERLQKEVDKMVPLWLAHFGQPHDIGGFYPTEEGE